MDTLVSSRRDILMRSPPHYMAAWEQLGPTYFCGHRTVHTKNSVYHLLDGVCFRAERNDGLSLDVAVGLRLIGFIAQSGGREAPRLSPDFVHSFSAVFWRKGATATQEPFLLTSPAQMFVREGHASIPPAPTSHVRALRTSSDSLTRIHLATPDRSGAERGAKAAK